jgi:hypothetical protein
MSSRARITSRIAGLALVVLITWADLAAAQCTYTLLVSKVPATASSGLQYYNMTPNAPYWSVVGVRPNVAGEDWDISVWQNAAPYPDCVSSQMMASEEYGPQMDFVIGDFNHTPLNTYRVAVTRWAGSGTGLVEWWGGSDQIALNVPRVEKTIGAAGPIHVYDVSLVAGTAYTFHFSPKGSADVHLCVFENAGGGAFFGNRAGAALETNHCVTYTPSVSGWHGVAVVCDWGEGTYELGVTTGACSCPTQLADGAPVDVPGDYYDPVISLFAMPQTNNEWAAIGVRYDGTLPASYLEAYSEPYGSAAPVCLSGLLASDYGTSGGRNWQVLAGDFNLSSPRTDYALVYAEADVRAEWQQSEGYLFVNDGVYDDGFAAGDVLDVFEIYLDAGTAYSGTIGWAGVRLRVYAPSSGAQFASTLLLDTAGDGVFTAPTTGWYGVVVINVTATAKSYGLEFRTCADVVPLTSKSPQSMYGEYARYSFAQTDQYWAAVGIRNMTQDFDLKTSAELAAYPDCVGPGWSSADFKPFVDYVIGDFNHNARTTYYAEIMTYGEDVSQGNTSIEWDAGTDQIATNGSPARGTWTAKDVLDVYDVFLRAGRTYVFNVWDPHGRLDFYYDNGAPYWNNPLSKTFTVASGGSHSYTAPVNDWYGVVIVHTDDVPGTYVAWVQDQTTDVDESLPLVTGLTSLEPNPSRGLVRLEYSLRERGNVGFRALDMAGREVWRSAPEAREAGRWTAEWGGTDESGRRLAPGLYFVRMTVDDREIALRKITLLR